MGKEYDLERDKTGGQIMPDGLPERNFTVKEGDVGN
jgi:hypothetical protein